jgi:cytochrome c peroxidase
MKILKLAVCFAFVISIGAFALLTSDPVKGQAGGSLSSPTGVMASDTKYRDKVRVEWDAIRGATLYRVFRGTTANSGTASDIGTTAANTFLDVTATPAQTFFYWVRAENTGSVSALSLSDQGTRSNTAQQGPVAPLGPPPVPAGNPITAAKVYLGKALFWDEQMSSTRTVACGTCHKPAAGGDDLSTQSISTNPGPNQFFGDVDDIFGSRGIPATNLDGTYLSATSYGLNEQVTGRNSQSFLNAAYSPELFWDGRASGTFRDPLTNAVIINNGAALESQVLGPPLSGVEMAHTGRDWNDVAARISTSRPLALATNIPKALETWIGERSYIQLFTEVFGTAGVTPARIALAIATYERILYTDQTPVDLANAGITPLTQQEQRGRNIFASPANNCAVCHGGSQTTNNAFFYIGVRPDTDDISREAVTGFPNDRGTFRVPSLRNVELRGTFFHNGRFTTLEEVVAFYNRGGDFDANNKPNLVTPLGLNPQQQADLVAFLRRPLTDPRVAAELAPFDRPTLFTESSRMPKISGEGRPGAGGFVPQIQAISPPLAGNPNFTVSVSGATGNADAYLVFSTRDPGVGATIPSSTILAERYATTQNTGDGNGWASVSVSIPDNFLYSGRTIYARWYILDPNAINGFSVTPAIEFTIFGGSRFLTTSTTISDAQ